MRIGFVINPIAGMGGPVGLKGTDGAEILDAAVRLGASRRSPERARAALRALSLKGLDIELLTSADEMGARVASEEGLRHSVVHSPVSGANTTGEDTVRATEAFLREGANIVLFCGGDGTARDIVAAADAEVPIVGIPAGVKMHSSVFSHTPAEAADLVESYVRGNRTTEAEVMDVDEEAFRKGEVSVKLHAIALIPDDLRYSQSSKAVYSDATATSEAEEIAVFMTETMESGVLYILGPGSTTAAIAHELGEEKTGLGVDAFIDGKLAAADLSEEGLMDLVRVHGDAMIIVTPIGSQGFIFGRGNQQISPRVIEAVGEEHIVVVATPTKLRDTPVLRVDTGDSQMDDSLRGHMKVVSGYRRKAMLEIL